MRLENKVAVVVGGGQSPGQGVGNGRAAAMLYAREGAKVLVVDRALASADETVAAIRNEGGIAEPFQADVTVESDLMRSEEHTSELQSLMRISYAVFCLKKKKK